MRSKTTDILLALVAVLLAANLITGLRPAQAQGDRKLCMGMSSVWDGREIKLFRVWSDGDVEQKGTVTWSNLFMKLKPSEP